MTHARIPSPIGSWYRNLGRNLTRARYPRWPRGKPRLMRVVRQKLREEHTRAFVRAMHAAIDGHP